MFSSNSAALIGCYMVCCLNMSAEDAFRKLTKKGATTQKFAPFRDCGRPQAHNSVDVIDVMKAVENARNRGWYDWRTFDVQQYNKMSELFNGDQNWIIPGSIIATSSMSVCESEGHDPRLLIPKFKKNNVTAVVRLNERLYEDKHFENNNIRVYPME